LTGKVLLQCAQIGRGGDQRRRGGAQHSRLLARGDLVQVHVMQPQRLAVGDDGLLERLFVDKAETVGARELERAGGSLGARGT
jgi:hypothetical protein